ncbi:MAG: hypothetical protein ABL934_15090 [Lysobacteraceae bacterium]
MRLPIIATATLLATICANNSIASARLANAPQEVTKNYGNGLLVILKCRGSQIELQKEPCYIQVKMRRHQYRINLDQVTTYGYTHIYQDFIVFGSAEHEDVSIRLPVLCGNWKNDEALPTDFLDCSLHYEQRPDGFKLRCLEKNGYISGKDISECIKPEEIKPPEPYP